MSTVIEKGGRRTIAQSDITTITLHSGAGATYEVDGLHALVVGTPRTVSTAGDIDVYAFTTARVSWES
jgi:hypothetical protein